MLSVTGGGTMSTMVSVFDVAQYILQTIGAPISTMKLQKLVYYCQAWHLAWTGKPLFKEKFEAWVNGPVCPELFKLHKGQFFISKIGLQKLTSQLTAENQRRINLVLEAYGKYSGAELSYMTHKEKPWKEARRGISVNENSSHTISTESMRNYYSSLH